MTKKIVKKANNLLFVFQAYKISWFPVVLLCGIFLNGVAIAEKVVEFIYYPWFILLTEAVKSDFVNEYIFILGVLYMLPSIILFLELLLSAFFWKENFTKKEEKIILFFSIAGFLTDISHILMLFAGWF